MRRDEDLVALVEKAIREAERLRQAEPSFQGYRAVGHQLRALLT